MSTAIHLWSCPRNVSTAFMYSWAQRSDTRVYDEPLYGHFLRVTGTSHPGREETLAAMETDGATVVQTTFQNNSTAPLLFFKQMTHHLVDIDRSFLGEGKNILFIRDPRAILASYIKVIAEPTMADIGVKAQYELWQEWGAQGKIHAVLDSQYLLQDPEGVLRQLCGRLDIAYEPAMLAWEAGPRPEDGPWARYWYANVHKSTGFAPYRPKEIDLPSHLEDLAAECQPYYEFLTAKSIR